MSNNFLPEAITWFRLPDYVRRLNNREYTLDLKTTNLSLLIDGTIVSTADLSGLGGGGSQTLQETVDNGNTTSTNILFSGTTQANFGVVGNAIYDSGEGNDLLIDSVGQIRNSAEGGNLITLLGQNSFSIQNTVLSRNATFDFFNSRFTFLGASGASSLDYSAVTGTRVLTIPNNSGIVPLSVNGNTPDAAGDITIPAFEPRTVDTTTLGATFNVAINATDHRNKWLVTSQQDAVSGVLALNTAGVGQFTPGDELIFINNGTGEVRVTASGVTVITPAGNGTGPIFTFQEGERLSIVIIDGSTVSYHVTTT